MSKEQKNRIQPIPKRTRKDKAEDKFPQYQQQQFNPKEVLELWNSNEFGAYIGWDRRKVNIYYKRDQEGTLTHHFPQPKAFTKSGIPLWTEQQVKAYARYIDTNLIYDFEAEAPLSPYWVEINKPDSLTTKEWQERMKENRRKEWMQEGGRS